MSKKVLFILRIPPPYGGGEIVSKELYDLLNDKYDFLLIKHKGHSKSRQANPDTISVIRGLQFIYLSMIRIIKNKPQILYIGLSKGLGSFLRNSIVILFAKLTGKKVYGELHGMSFLFLDSTLFRKYFFFIIKRVDKIRVLGESIKTYLEDLGYKKDIYIINNGITRPAVIAINNQINYGCVNFLYLGGISKKKGFGIILSVLDTVEKEGYSNWRLNVIGEWVNQSEKEEYINYLYENQLNNKVKIYGKKIEFEKWELINKNDFLLHITEFDGQPLTIIESMSMGIPTISTKVGAIPEMIIPNKTGFLIENKLHCCEVIKIILSKNIDYKLLSENCFKRYEEKYTGSVMAKNITVMVEN